MKVIDAYWEKRNLKCDTLEIVLDSDDDIKSIEGLGGQIKNKYVVVKAPVANYQLNSDIQNLGFHFVEMSFELSMNTKDFVIPPCFTKFNDKISYEQMIDMSDFRHLFKEIDKGIFNTDRIALDPFFGPSVSALRYNNWIEDERERGTPIFKILYEDRMIGFFSDPLSGMFLDTPVGTGFSMITKRVEEYRKQGKNRVEAKISSNNLSSLRLSNRFGFITNNIQVVYVKHPTE